MEVITQLIQFRLHKVKKNDRSGTAFPSGFLQEKKLF